ncbi:MAG: PriCT-2 domain-containing protein [Cyanobacteria bacterium J06621_8]
MFDYSPEPARLQGRSARSLEPIILARLIAGLNKLPSWWRLVPCINKRPLGKEWQKNYFSPQTLYHCLSQEGKVWVRGRQGLFAAVPNGYSLLCGRQVNGHYLIAIDCDSIEAINRLQQVGLPKTVSYSSGLPGRMQCLYYLDQPIKSFKSSLSLEVRGENLLSTLPPSVHPKTGGYYWLSSPISSRSGIVTISSLWLNQLKPKPTYSKGESKSSFKSYPIKSADQAERLVYSISPVYADNYHDWIRIGMALKDWDEGLLWLWDDWSRSSAKYRQGQCEYKWKSFNGSGITYKTVYYYAMIS